MGRAAGRMLALAARRMRERRRGAEGAVLRPPATARVPGLVCKPSLQAQEYDSGPNGFAIVSLGMGRLSITPPAVVVRARRRDWPGGREDGASWYRSRSVDSGRGPRR